MELHRRRILAGVILSDEAVRGKRTAEESKDPYTGRNICCCSSGPSTAVHPLRGRTSAKDDRAVFALQFTTCSSELDNRNSKLDARNSRLTLTP
jgi:hypothetical protein